jgi:formylglycine-generating enzyme required for sulfatase activity
VALHRLRKCALLLLAATAGLFFAGGLTLTAPLMASSIAQAAVGSTDSAASGQAGSRQALVVGNAQYAAGRLANTLNDARAMARKLESIGFQVRLMEDVSEAALSQALSLLGQRAHDSEIVFFYFAGHSVTSPERMLLLPVDARVAGDGDPVPGAIAMDRVTDLLGGDSSKTAKLVVLDTTPYPVKSRYRGLQVGSKPVVAPPNFLIAHSNGLAAAQRTDPPLSVFTKALLDVIGTPDRSADEVLKTVRAAVSETTNRSQSPWHSSSLPRDIYLVSPYGAGRDAPTAESDQDAQVVNRGIRLPAPAETPHARLEDRPPGKGSETAQASGRSQEFEGALWNMIKESGNPADFEAYLEVFPKGRFASEAKQRITVLRTPAPAKPAPAAPKIEPVQGEFDVVVAANIRESPDSSAPILGTAGKGERIVVTGRVVGQNWYQVRTSDGTTAYVASNLLREPQTAEPKAAPKVAMIPPRDTAPSPSGAELRDCPDCPTLVRVSAGSFRMGSEKGDPSEQPAHTVRVAKQFAIGKYEVTVAEWKACAAAKACTYVPDLKDVPDTAPVHRLSWNDIQEYLGWLKKVTGQPYRLPSEAEWEYAARGGSDRRYWWGDRMDAGMADCKDCGSGWSYKSPAPVTMSKANPFGVHGVSGGVWEWTDDCWNASYDRTPTDGSAAGQGDCTARVLRGGSWRNDAGYAHAASRLRYDFNVRYSTNGFRVARDLR